MSFVVGDRCLCAFRATNDITFFPYSSLSVVVHFLYVLLISVDKKKKGLLLVTKSPMYDKILLMTGTYRIGKLAFLANMET